MSRQFALVLAVSTMIVFVGPETVIGQSQLGAKAGLAVTNFLGDSDPEFEQKINFTGGFTFLTAINRNLSLQPELLYAVKGSKTSCRLLVTSQTLSCTEESGGTQADLSFVVTYLEVPVLLRYAFSPRSDVTPFLAAGPAVSWNVDSRVKYSEVGSDLVFTESDESIKELDLGVAAEAGFDIRWDLRTISIGARYTYGVSNVIDNPDDPKHNGAFAVTAGIGL